MNTYKQLCKVFQRKVDGKQVTFDRDSIHRTCMDLISMFPNKFELVDERKATQPEPQTASENVGTVTETVDVSKEVKVIDAKHEHVEEVEESELDKVADEAGLTVEDLGRGWFNVYDPDEDKEKPLNKKGLRGEDTVKKFINDYVNG